MPNAPASLPGHADLSRLADLAAQVDPEQTQAGERLQPLRQALLAVPGDLRASTGPLRDHLLGRRDAGCLWILLTQLHLEQDQALPALQCWHQAALHPPSPRHAPAMQALGLDDAAAWQRLVDHMSQLRAHTLREAYAPLREGASPRDLFRIDRALAGYLGQAAVFSSHPTQRPKLMFVPGLSGAGFIDPARHPLVAPLTAAAAGMRDEFDQAMGAGSGIEPFLGDLAGQDRTAYLSGRLGASWDALFFYRHGQRYDDNHRRFPHTSRTLDALPLCRIDGQAPEICFSILQPGTRIEPHHGVTNARVVIHIPLRVPPGCFLELVDIGRHYWREGQAMVFDDTFLHAAENPSDAPRGILLLDAWHPDLSTLEQQAFRALVQTLTRIEQPAAH